jgi:hypothetical protein
MKWIPLYLLLAAIFLVQSCCRPWDDDKQAIPPTYRPLYWLSDSSRSILGTWPKDIGLETLPMSGYIIAVASDGQSIWAATQQPNRIYRFNRASHAVEHTYELGDWKPTAIAVTAGYVWLGESSGNRLIALQKADLAKQKVFSLPEKTEQIITSNHKIYLRQANGTIRLWLENAFAEIWQGRVKGESQWFGLDRYNNVSILAKDSSNQWLNSSIDANGNVFTTLDQPTNIIQLALTPYTYAPYEREYIRDVWLNSSGETSIPNVGKGIERISVDFNYSVLAFQRQDSLYHYSLNEHNRNTANLTAEAIGKLNGLQLRSRY